MIELTVFLTVLSTDILIAFNDFTLLALGAKVTYSMIFEFANGGTLHDYLMDHKDLPWRDITRLGLEVTNALKYLHNENIIHKDLVCHSTILQAVFTR